VLQGTTLGSRTRQDNTAIVTTIMMMDRKITDNMDQAEKERRAGLVIQLWWAKYQVRKQKEMIAQIVREEEGEQQAKDDFKQTEPKSCFIFPEDNSLREVFKNLNEDGYFQFFIIVAIIISSITLAFEHPEDDPEATKADVLFVLDVLFTLLFIFEMTSKMIADGVCMAEASYLRDPWNQMDFCIVIVSAIGLLPFANDIKVLRVARTFRVLRPLRALRKFPQLAALTATLVNSLVPLGIVAVICFFVISIFAVLWIALQKGRVFRCSVDEDMDDHKHYFTYVECLAEGGEWVAAQQSYDNYFRSLLTLFEVMTLEDWQGVMYNSIDTTDIKALDAAGNWHEESYERQYRGTWWWGIMFLVFVMVGAFFFRPRPPGAVKRPWRSLVFSYENSFYMGLLRGRAGRLTAQNGGFRPGQSTSLSAWSSTPSTSTRRWTPPASTARRRSSAARPGSSPWPRRSTPAAGTSRSASRSARSSPRCAGTCSWRRPSSATSSAWRSSTRSSRKA
jgi:hypothetical protein